MLSRLPSRLRSLLCEAQAAAPLLASCGTGVHSTALLDVQRVTDAHCPDQKGYCCPVTPFNHTAARHCPASHEMLYQYAARPFSAHRRSSPGTAEEQLVFEETCGIPHSDEEDMPLAQAEPVPSQQYDRRYV